MVDCPSCGAPINDRDRTCAECGVRIEGATRPFPPVGESDAVTGELVTEGAVLVVLKGPEVGERFFVDRPELTLGRDPACDVFLNDVTVSRRHAIVRLEGGQVSVEDAGSLNGTYVNGAVVEKALLRSGDTLQVGRFMMSFLDGGEGA